MTSDINLYEWLDARFVCPMDKSPLQKEGNWLVSTQGRKYPIVDGIPVFLSDEKEHTAWWSKDSLEKACKIANGEIQSSRKSVSGNSVHPFVQAIVASTCGYLYKNSIGRLNHYPIPNFPMKNSPDKILLDVGCNWGRWSISSSRKGFLSIGVDPNLEAILTAKEVASQLDVNCAFFVGDARFLPFKSDTFDAAFSYSVIQHFSKENARKAFMEVNRVVKPQGQVLIQMPNKYGIRSLYHLAKRKFAEGEKFDVRYYSPKELINIFLDIFGNCKIRVDGYFGLGIQKNDFSNMTIFNKAVIICSELLKKMSLVVPPMKLFADSLYIESKVMEENHSENINSDKSL